VFKSKEFHDFCKAVGIDIAKLTEPFTMTLEEGVVFGAQLESGLFIHCHPSLDGYVVYNLPEFIDLCQRFGIAWPLLTKSLTFTIAEGELLTIQ
jgi:hypothetical protein